MIFSHQIVVQKNDYHIGFLIIEGGIVTKQFMSQRYDLKLVGKHLLFVQQILANDGMVLNNLRILHLISRLKHDPKKRRFVESLKKIAPYV